MHVDFGAKHGKFNVEQALVKRDAVARNVLEKSAQEIAKLCKILKQLIQDGSISLYLNLYIDDY